MTGIAACVPIDKSSNLEYENLSLDERKKLIKTIGIEYRHIAKDNQCTSDFCFEAAEKLIKELNWNKNEIEILIFVSQTPDYPFPATSILLQNRLGLEKSCIAFDINLGCSGYVYGIAVIGNLISSMKLKKGLLLVGEVATKTTTIHDRSAYPLFGDAGTATAFEYSENANKFFFDFGSDGSGYNAILMKTGNIAGRFPYNRESLVFRKIGEGIERCDVHVSLDGLEIFNFSLREVPKTIRKIIGRAEINIDDIDSFILHQANFIMNDTIRKKLNIPIDKVPYSLNEFGNTSSASIPLTLVYRLREKLTTTKLKILMCGFGVGLSWGTIITDIEKIVCPDIIEI